MTRGLITCNFPAGGQWPIVNLAWLWPPYPYPGALCFGNSCLSLGVWPMPSNFCFSFALRKTTRLDVNQVHSNSETKRVLTRRTICPCLSPESSRTDQPQGGSLKSEVSFGSHGCHHCSKNKFKFKDPVGFIHQVATQFLMELETILVLQT